MKEGADGDNREKGIDTEDHKISYGLNVCTAPKFIY